MKKLWGFIGFATLILTLANQKIVADAVLDGMKRCVYSIIPTLFANSVICSIITRSGIIRCLFSRLKQNGLAWELFILGNLGGYPIGAKLIRESVENNEISSKVGEKLLACCFSPGPAFCIGVIGRLVFKNQWLGVAVYLVNLAVNLIIFVISSRNMRKVKSHYSTKNISTAEVIESVNSAANSMISITAIIAIFSGITAIILNLFSFVKLEYFTPFLDITNIVSIKNISLPETCALVSFGGICIFAQIAGIIGGKLSLKRFAIMHLIRLPMNCCIGLLGELIIDRFGITASAVQYSEANSFVPFICVIAMLYICTKRNPDRSWSG